MLFFISLHVRIRNVPVVSQVLPNSAQGLKHLHRAQHHNSSKLETMINTTYLLITTGDQSSLEPFDSSISIRFGLIEPFYVQHVAIIWWPYDQTNSVVFKGLQLFRQCNEPPPPLLTLHGLTIILQVRLPHAIYYFTRLFTFFTVSACLLRHCPDHVRIARTGFPLS